MGVVEDTYPLVISVLALILGPLGVGGAVFLWQLYAADRQQDDRDPKPILRLSLVMASTATIGAACGIFFGIVVGMGLIGMSRPSWVAPLSSVVFLALLLIPLMNAGYLRWLRRKRYREGGAPSPPPWSRHD